MRSIDRSIDRERTRASESCDRTTTTRNDTDAQAGLNTPAHTRTTVRMHGRAGAKVRPARVATPAHDPATSPRLLHSVDRTTSDAARMQLEALHTRAYDAHAEACPAPHCDEE